MRQVEHEEIKLQLGGMLFTWDDEKERINIRKHGVDFRTAASVFLDGDIGWKKILLTFIQVRYAWKL